MGTFAEGERKRTALGEIEKNAHRPFGREGKNPRTKKREKGFTFGVYKGGRRKKRHALRNCRKGEDCYFRQKAKRGSPNA